MANKSGGFLRPFADKVEGLPSRSKHSTPEDEHVTWLQYPLDFTHERDYCSELFERQAPSASSLGKAKLDICAQGVPMRMEKPGREKGMCAGSENARHALALGAGRASGSIFPKGAETFDKVKTIMQQAPCSQSNSFQHKASSVEKPFSTTLPFRGLSNPSLLAGEYPAYYRAMHNFPSNCMWSSISSNFPNRGMERLRLSEDAAAGSVPCESSHLVIPNRIEKGPDGRAYIQHTEGSSHSFFTEDHRRDASMHVASVERTGCNAGTHEAGTSVRLVPPSEGKKGRETCGSMHVLSCSVDSQTTSAELSGKENVLLVQKALDNNECQSKNAEVDSAKNSQSQRRRLPKRSRVAESHNLSEKRRRNRINEKLKVLQELIPNSSKTDKASILDEAIEYLKALQSQLQMMSLRSGMKLSSMSFPLGMQHTRMSLGFPLVHAGEEMGSMELQHGMDGRVFQAPSAASPYFDFAYRRTALAHSQTFLALEVPSCELCPLQPSLRQTYHQMYVHPQMVTSTEQGDQPSTPRVSKAV